MSHAYTLFPILQPGQLARRVADIFAYSFLSEMTAPNIRGTCEIPDSFAPRIYDRDVYIVYLTIVPKAALIRCACDVNFIRRGDDSPTGIRRDIEKKEVFFLGLINSVKLEQMYVSE